MAENQAVALRYSDNVVDYVVNRCLVQETGARLLIGFIEQHVLPLLAKLWLDSLASKHVLTRVDLDVADPAAAPTEAFALRAS
ncbi:SciG protein [Burkholderia pseudomallei]|nr:SciG protein [Burkholderia pseudomallei]